MSADGRWRWWGVLALLFLLLSTPGPQDSPFSGVPFSSQTLALFIVGLIVAVFSAFFSPRARVRTLWLVALAALVAAKMM